MIRFSNLCIVVCLTCLFAIACPSLAANAYVDALAGSGETCSEASPCATIAAGITAVGDGDTVYIKGDPASYDTYTYAENNLLAGNTKAITFQPWNAGEKVAVGGDSANPIFWGVTNGKALAFVNLKITNANAGQYASAIRSTYNGANPASSIDVSGCTLSSAASGGTIIINRSTSLSGAGVTVINSAGPALGLSLSTYTANAVTFAAGSSLQGRPAAGGSPGGVITLSSGSVNQLTLTDTTITTDWTAGLGTSFALYIVGELQSTAIFNNCTIAATGSSSEFAIGVNGGSTGGLLFNNCQFATDAGRIAYIFGTGGQVSEIDLVDCTITTASTSGLMQVATPAALGFCRIEGGSLTSTGNVYTASTGTVSNLLIKNWTCTANSAGSAYIFDLQKGHENVLIDGLTLTGTTSGALFLIGGENTVLGDPVAATATNRFDVINSTFTQNGTGHAALVGRGATPDAHAIYMSLPAWSTELGTPDIGTMIRPTAMNGWWYVCTVSGAVGESEPTWNTTEGGSTVDGSATWRTMRLLFPAGHARFSNNIIRGATAGPAFVSKWFNVEVTNNRITSSAAGATGILLKGARNNLIAHNSVYMPDGTCFTTSSNYSGDAYYGTCQDNVIRDNIFQTDSSTGYSVDLPGSTQSGSIFDHNVYWAPNSHVWRIEGFELDTTPYVEGGMWPEPSIFEYNDQHSLVANPVFLSTSPTHALFLVPSLWSRARNAASMPNMTIGAMQQTSGLQPLYLGGKR